MPRVAEDRNGKPRQDPVSCQLCRIKKLKCDRNIPCSNCQARGLTCEYTRKIAAARPSLATTDASHSENFDYRTENQTLKARLRRLEEAVFGETPQSATLSAEQNQPSMGTVEFATPKSRIEDDKADEDSTWLETIGNRSDAVLPYFTPPLTVNICTLDQFLNPDQKYSPTRTVDIPTYDVAADLLTAYSEHLDAAQHIMDVESTRHMIDRVYAQVHAGQSVDPGALALILSLCANTGFYWTVGMYQMTSIFQDGETAFKISSEWTKQAMVAMEQARNGTSMTSLEAIQASILLMFFLYHVEGATFRVRMMHATTVAMSRDLGLHKTDVPGFRPAVQTQAHIVELEVRRKLWWHVACTDWFLSFIGGPHEGVYSIHPNHSKVNLPRNLTREDLRTQPPDFQRSLSELTLMSYYIQRVRLATTCREITDALYQTPQATDANYDKVRLLDAKFETQLQELPRFLRFDLPAAQLRAEYGAAYDQQTSMQAVMINLMLATRRCKLHMPYLIRAKTNPKYAFSRSMGLQAARLVFNVRRVVMESNNAIHLKLGGIRQHIFYATVIMVMDLCVNREDDNPGQLVEVREALQIIQEEGRGGSSLSMGGDKFYDSLMAVLRKHHVKLPPSQPVYPTSEIVGQGIEPAWNPFPNQDNSQGSFDGAMWSDFLSQAPLLHAQDWDALLSDLDMRMI